MTRDFVEHSSWNFVYLCNWSGGSTQRFQYFHALCQIYKFFSFFSTGRSTSYCRSQFVLHSIWVWWSNLKRKTMSAFILSPKIQFRSNPNPETIRLKKYLANGDRTCFDRYRKWQALCAQTFIYPWKRQVYHPIKAM